MCCRRRFLPNGYAAAGQLVWRRHRGSSTPSHHALRATCMELLPLLEMYYRWELEEDCGNLRTLMVRFDSEASLEMHELGRSLLLMIRDDDIGLQFPPTHQESVAPSNPFDAIRGRLAAVDLAFQSLHAQVNAHVGSFPSIAATRMRCMSPATAVCLFRVFCPQQTLEFKF